MRQLSHPALPSWPEGVPRGRYPQVGEQRLDEGLRQLWQSEDHSDEDLHHIRKMADGLEG